MRWIDKMRRKHLVGFWKQVSAKKQVAGALTITLLLSLVLLSSSLIQFSKVSKAANPSDFDNYQILTIDHTQVPSDLTNFPVLVYNSSWITGLNATSFTFFQPDNSTECNWELEKYDSSTGELVAWVNISSISSTTDTTFYLYYDSSNSTDGGENNPSQTWNHSIYVAVYHMGGTGNVEDSTGNGHTAYEQNTVPSATGIVGGCRDFDGSADYFNISDSDDFTFNSAGDDTEFTISCWVNMDSNIKFWAVCKYGSSYEWELQTDASGYLYQICNQNGTAGTYIGRYYNSALSTGNWQRWVGRYDGTESSAGIDVFLNNSIVDNADFSGGTYTGMVNTNEQVYIGSTQTATPIYANGKIDEVRICKVKLSDAWLTAEYNNINNKTTFVTFSQSQSVSQTTLSIHGNPNNEVTYEGELGDTVMFNNTGTYYEWMEFQLSDGIEYLRINITDMPASITSANFSYQFTSDNSSWNPSGNWKSGSSGGWSFIINGSTWTSANGCYGTNPFTVDDDGDGYNEVNNSASIWVVGKVSIPSGINIQTYTDTVATRPTWDAGVYS